MSAVDVGTSDQLDEVGTVSVSDLIRSSRERQVEPLLGYLELNQGMPTFTGRMTLEQFSDLSVVHNKRWAGEAGQSLDVVTQRDIIEGHATALAAFMVQGLVSATAKRAEEDAGFPETVEMALNRIQDRMGADSAHYGLPQVTLVLPPGTLDIRPVPEVATGKVVAHRLFLQPGKLFIVADGQHRREAARRVREFLNDTISNRRTPRSKIYPAQDAPLSPEEVDAWIAIQDTFRSATLISYEAHIGLTVGQARQLFTNYNCNVKPVKADLNLEFDQSNPINRFSKELLAKLPKKEGSEVEPLLDLRQLGVINGFVFLGKTSIKSAPYNVENERRKAEEFWKLIFEATDWSRADSLIRDVPVLKGLAKAWFYVYLAKRNSRSGKASQLRNYIKATRFDWEWAKKVEGLMEHTVSTSDGGFRFSPAHNDIVARIVADSLK